MITGENGGHVTDPELREAAEAVLAWWESDSDHHGEFIMLRAALRKYKDRESFDPDGMC